ncbi:MAG: penicillin-binding protein 2, partial [Rhodothermales bacterium]|nr:penicillin-binding protein 2 [Rhodothermales bacterium]
MNDYKSRARIYSSVILVVLALLALRLAKLQIIDRQAHTGESMSNSVKLQRILPARGMIFDRNGRLMVDNEAGHNLMVTPVYFDTSSIGLLADLLELPDSTIRRRVDEARSYSRFRPSPLALDISFQALSRVMENANRLPGVTPELFQKRDYKTRARASHVLGYVREITPRDLETRGEDGYRRGDQIGHTGIERQYEGRLRGEPGSDFRLVNIRGQVVGDYLGGREDEAPLSGYDLHLTIDADLQALAESLFVNKRGGVVALDPRSGEVLALHSAPDFDLDLFTGRIPPAAWDYLMSAEQKPMFNRATQSTLMPGSTFKPFIALMALHEGVITPNETVHCPGYHPRGGGRFFKCLDRHGSLTILEAIEKSCNTFFFEMMKRIDVSTFNRWAHEFGFGERPDVDVPATEIATGNVPDSAYFDRQYGRGGWNVGTPMNMGIGQGDISVTPLQLVRYVSAIANGGTLPTPYLVRQMVHSETGEIIQAPARETELLDVNPAYLDIVRTGMRSVIEKTSWWLDIPGVESAGKTGTAQNNRGEDDSVFIMFAPADDPQIAIAVLVENIGFGSMSAGPIASFMAEQYLTGSIDAERRWLWTRVMEAKSEPLPGQEEPPDVAALTV